MDQDIGVSLAAVEDTRHGSYFVLALESRLAEVRIGFEPRWGMLRGKFDDCLSVVQGNAAVLEEEDYTSDSKAERSASQVEDSSFAEVEECIHHLLLLLICQIESVSCSCLLWEDSVP